MPIAAFFRRLKRVLTPPGNRPPAAEAGETRDGPTGLEPQSMGGAILDQQNQMSGGL